MTLKEIKRQIDTAQAEYEANKVNADGSYNAEAAGKLWDSWPRIFYKDLPAKLKKEADKITIDGAKRFLLECYPVGKLDAIAADQTVFNDKIAETLHAARYLIQSIDTTPPKPTGNAAVDAAALEAFSPVSLIGVDFIEAWEKITNLAPAVISNTTSVTPEQVSKVLPQLSIIIPQKHIISIHKLANSLTSKEKWEAGKFNLDVGKKKGDMKILCILSYEGDNVQLTGKQPFTEYDRQVADAVTSLYEYGDKSHIVTAATVYRAMVHATETETPSPQQIDAVTRSLDKMRFMRVRIDCSEELTKRKLSLNGAQITGGKIDTYLLNMESVEVEAGGQKVVAYKVVKTPILYEYSHLIGQVITVPAEFLDIRDESGAKVSNTERRIAIKGYLMRRISVMKGKTATSRHILFDSIYDEVHNSKDNKPTDKEKRAIREYIPQVLDYWKRQRFIKGYSYIKQGKKRTGISIST